MPVKYKPFDEREPDEQYRNLLKRILNEGDEKPSPQKYIAKMILGHTMRFPLSNGFPIITERDVYSKTLKGFSFFNSALGELFAFLNGAATQEELKAFGCSWWDRWTSKEYIKMNKLNLKPGELGRGSYGAVWTNLPMPDGRGFNQIKAVIEQIKIFPYIRRHFVTAWYPPFVFLGQKDTESLVAVAPCHGNFHIEIYTDTNELSLLHIQRSADTPVGLAANLIQYAALTMMFAQVLGYTARELVYIITDAHMYISDDPKFDQRPAVRKMLDTNPGKFPTVHIDPRVKDIFSFRQKHFKVKDYHPRLGRMKIWTPT